MGQGKGAAARRDAKKKAKRRALGRKPAEQAVQEQPAQGLPIITEDDLLAFQIAHFGDGAKPEMWFVDAETACGYDPAFDGDFEYDDDGLGYYDDGVKRTLTDEQIELFRHSEIEQMVREGRMEREGQLMIAGNIEDMPVKSPASTNSSIEDELLGLGKSKFEERPTTTSGHQPSQSNRSSDSRSISAGVRPREDVPYDQRHKRKWEDFIDENDSIEGSLTHRRIARELDEQRDESVQLDY